MESWKFTIGLLRETATSWEGRVALTPKAVAHFVKNGIRVLLQTSNQLKFKLFQVIQDDLKMESMKKQVQFSEINLMSHQRECAF